MVSKAFDLNNCSCYTSSLSEFIDPHAEPGPSAASRHPRDYNRQQFCRRPWSKRNNRLAKITS